MGVIVLVLTAVPDGVSNNLVIYHGVSSSSL